MEKENQIIDGYEDDTTTTAFGDKIQAFMDEVYSEWQKEENKGKSKWDVLDGFPAAYQIAVVFGNFNYQVENGGLEQWIYNGYFHDDAEKFTEYLEAGVGLDDRCRTILDRIYKLDQYARETDCDRNGYYRDPDDEDGEGGFIGNLMNCDAFATWYYGHCGKEDWWETVCRTIEKAEEHGLRLSDRMDTTGKMPQHLISAVLRRHCPQCRNNSRRRQAPRPRRSLLSQKSVRRKHSRGRSENRKQPINHRSWSFDFVLSLCLSGRQ